MLVKLFLLNLLFLSIIFTSNGQQEINFTKEYFPLQGKELAMAKRNLSKGDLLFGNGKYETALKYYLKANDFNPDNSVLNNKIGQCHFYSNNDSALYFFQKSLDLNKNPELDNNLFMARIFHQNYQFDSAISKYHEFIRDLLQREDEEKTEQLEKLNKLIRECEAGKGIMNTSVDMQIENYSKKMTIEGMIFSDYAVYVTDDDSLLFFTSVRKAGNGNTKEQNDIDTDENIYMSVRSKGKTEAAMNIGVPVNTGRNDAIIGLSSDGKTMYVYSENNNGDIYYSYKNDEKWTEPLIFSDKINSEATESSLAFSLTKDTVFFVSNRPGTYGNRDIFYSIKNGDDWSYPLNIGATINTKYDEEGVFVDHDTIYFASKGHNTMGGYDIFKSYKTGSNQWSEPVNLGYPVNTPFDDIFYASNKNHVYFASNRDGQSQIYCIDRIIFPEEKVLPVKDLTIIPLEDFLIIRDIKFEVRSYVNTQVHDMLDSLVAYLIKNPEAIIKISGYTDTQGGETFNTRLSNKRAYYVKNYLVKKGVKEQNLVIEGKGWSKQISKNKNDKGQILWKSLGYNRRVEFEVLKQGNPKLLVQAIEVPDSFRTETTNIKNSDIYSILLAVSDAEITGIDSMIEDYSLYKGTDLKYYYYTGKFCQLVDAQVRRNELQVHFPEAKIFIHRFKNVDEGGHTIYKAIGID